MILHLGAQGLQKGADGYHGAVLHRHGSRAAEVQILAVEGHVDAVRVGHPHVRLLLADLLLPAVVHGHAAVPVAVKAVAVRLVLGVVRPVVGVIVGLPVGLPAQIGPLLKRLVLLCVGPGSVGPHLDKILKIDALVRLPVSHGLIILLQLQAAGPVDARVVVVGTVPVGVPALVVPVMESLRFLPVGPVEVGPPALIVGPRLLPLLGKRRRQAGDQHQGRQ